jgi:hypothetical protein
MRKLLFILLLFPLLLQAQTYVNNRGPVRQVYYAGAQDTTIQYFYSAGAYWYTNKSWFDFNKPIFSPMVYIGSDSAASRAYVRSKVGVETDPIWSAASSYYPTRSELSDTAHNIRLSITGGGSTNIFNNIKVGTSGDTTIILSNGTIHQYYNGSEVLYTTNKGHLGLKYNIQYNIGIGDSVLSWLTTGTNNIAIGHMALNHLTSTTSNTAIGYLSMASNNFSSANYNTGVGSLSLNSITTGDENTGIGTQSLKSVTTGDENTSIGTYSLEGSTGNKNTAIGTYSGQNNTGSGNIFIGYGSGDANSSVSNRLFISSIGYSSLAEDSTKSIIYGYQNATVSNQKLYINAAVKISGQIKQIDFHGNLTDGVPTLSELNTATGLTPSGVGAGFIGFVKDDNGTGLTYGIHSDGTTWDYWICTKAL